MMRQTPLYPLRFEPIYQYRPWGGRRLANWLSAALPREGTIGEAWVLSDRVDHPSQVADGPLKGLTTGQLIEQSPQDMPGRLGERFSRFPLLLKFLDAHEKLSVQVHPSGAEGKTEAWVVLEAGPAACVCAGLKPGTTTGDLRLSLTNWKVVDRLSCFTPKAGDGVFLPGGTVHTLGVGVVVFEVQQNSDVTFRLDDWNRVDATTGQLRNLQVEQAFACVNFGKSSAGLVEPVAESIWISYGPKGWNGSESYRLCQFSSHHCLASPVAPWERLKIGGGTPPVLSQHEWVIVYHGVSETLEAAGDGHSLSYAAGLIVLSKEHPSVIRYRSPEPVLSQERYGTVANIVFPTGIDVRDDIGFPNRFAIYYGMADQRIGVARLDLPERLPSEGAVGDSLKTQV